MSPALAKILRTTARAFAIALGAATLAACGGGGSAQPGQPGAVAVTLHQHADRSWTADAIDAPNGLRAQATRGDHGVTVRLLDSHGAPLPATVASARLGPDLAAQDFGLRTTQTDGAALLALLCEGRTVHLDEPAIPAPSTVHLVLVPGGR
jgi:hypothetical protein